MNPVIVGTFGLIVLMILLFSRVWIGFAMAFVGFVGFAYIGGIDAALGVLSTVPYGTVANYTVAVVPLFILMGAVASNAGISGDLYETGYKWMGHLPGGLSIGTIVACAGFAAICGSSMATAATMGKVALPEMKKYNYSNKLATGSVASGATLGILIPPSLAFILYGILTEESVGLLFIAGILPGILLSILFIATIIILVKRNPEIAPPGPKTALKEKIISLKYTWTMIVLFLLVMGGIYMGVFTPSEAGAIGAFGAIVIAGVSRRLKPRQFLASLFETGQITAMIMLLFVGAMIFMRFLAITKLPFALAEFVRELPLPPYVIFSAIVFVYVLLGMFLDVVSAVALTIPIIFPAIIALGFDPLWFGVIVTLVQEMGLITPPVGMNVYILAGVTDIPIKTIFAGVIPFVFAMVIGIIILAIFPQIALFLPNMMR